ncbi:hypothetical protein LTR64_006081 [Lithohypha guttulata]|uniref:uncharacterized protein n=1 Tax=Lithohypha guttulata TaxID=1690604 RepID=UPI002DDEEA65|nr:hypothetical protein LTR51_002121 [Lithohypha guttulata]
MASPMPGPAKPRPYRRFLTSALHTRFVHAASLALIWHQVLAGLASDWYTGVPAFFWAFFPIGPSGIKALLFTISSLFVFLLQISNLKFGHRCTPSNWITIKILFSSYSTYAVLFWYTISAFWFCEAFVFTSPPSQELGWIINGGYGAPDKLNERPIYFRIFFIIIAVIQSFLHLYQDASSAPRYTKEESSDTKVASLGAWLMPQVSVMFRTAVLSSGIASILGPFFYNGFLRNSLWKSHIVVARLIASIARSEANPPDSFYVGGIMLYVFLWGFALSLTWQIDLALFKRFMMQQPIRNGVPLSTLSKDPNGTLLQGLKTTNQTVKTFAFWELHLIATKYPERRKAIFADIERPSQPPMFLQMLTAGLDVVKAMESRMKELVSSPPLPSTNAQGGPLPDENLQHLPRILPNPTPAKVSIYQQPASATTLPQRAGNFISYEAKQIGSSPDAWQPPVEKGKQLAIEYSSPARETLHSRIDQAQQSPIGRYLLTSPRRLILSAILGTPTATPTLTLHAINSITTLLVESLHEDEYGRAIHSVPSTVQTFMNSILAIAGFVHKHTNGTTLGIEGDNELGEVDAIFKALKSNLEKLLDRFQGFVAGDGLSIRDLNEAQKATKLQDLFDNSTASEETKVGRQNSSGSASQPTRPQMEEVGNNRRPSNNNQPRRKTQAEIEAERADKNRPGRLFPQLDKGSKYRESRKQ